MKPSDYLEQVEAYLSGDATEDDLNTDIAALAQAANEFNRRLQTARGAGDEAIEAATTPLGEDEDPKERYAKLTRLMETLNYLHSVWGAVLRECNDYTDEAQGYYSLRARIIEYASIFGYSLPACVQDEDDDGNPDKTVVTEDDIPF